MKTESLFQSDPEDIFAKAIERVEAGETIEAVLATAPEALRAELREVLLLITATHHLQRAPVPQPPAPRRADRKKAFLAAATQMKAEAALDMPPVVTPAPVAKAQPVRPRQTKPTRAAGLATLWRTFLDSFNSPNFSLAPLATIIIAVYLGVFGFNEAAKAAELGDLTYPIKQWLGYQALSLSSEEIRPDLYGDLEIRLAKDVSKAQETLSTAEATKVAIITTESFLLVKGVEDDYLLVGPLRVLMKYQPDPNVDEYVPMAMSDIPGLNSQVELTFQIIANEETPNEPLAVQGRALKVITEGQLTFDNSQATTPVPPPPTQMHCNAAKPAGWEPALVNEGELLTTVAERMSVDLAELITVNCLDGIDNTIPAGMVMILAPKPAPTSTPPPTEPDLMATLTVYAEKTLTPPVEFTATVVPTATSVMTATAVPTGTVVMTATPELTGTVAVTGTVEATATMTATLVPTITAIATPSVTVTVTVTVPLTGQPTENTELKGTLTATAPISGGVEPPTGTPIAPPLTAVSTPETPATETPITETPTPTATPTTGNEGAATPSPTALLESSVSPTPAATPTPRATLNSTESGTSGQAVPTVAGATTDDGPGALPTATATPIPQNRSPLTGG